MPTDEARMWRILR